MAIKTVTCKACGAEQAIFRDENGEMKCAFCGEPIELPPYEEGEELDAQYSPDAPEEKPALTPVGEPIEAVFVLSEEEVGASFTAAGKVKERKYLLWIETVILLALGIVFLVFNIKGLKAAGSGTAGATAITTAVDTVKAVTATGLQKPGISEWLFVVLCFGLLPVVWLMPKRTRKKIIKNATSGNQLTITVYENLLNIHVEGHDPKDDWQQPFDGSYRLIRAEGLMILDLADGRILVIPERSLPEDGIETVAARLAVKPEAEASEEQQA